MNFNEYAQICNRNIELAKEAYEQARARGEKDKARELSNALYSVGYDAHRKIGEEIKVVELQIKDERDVEERNSLRRGLADLRMTQKNLVNFLDRLILDS